MKLDLISNKAEKKGDINPNDEYYTPEYAINPLLEYLKPNSVIWCPFDTYESYFVKLLSKAGHSIHYTHIQTGEDFFNQTPPLKVNYIISNPPYSLKTEVLQHLFKLNIPFAMLVGMVGIFESQKRFEMFMNNDFQILCFNKRISFYKNYSELKPSSNPPFSSVYICKNILPKQIVLKSINKI